MTVLSNLTGLESSGERAIGRPTVMSSRKMTNRALFNRRQLFQVNVFEPLLKFFRVLSLGFDLQDVTLGYHEPQGSMFAFVLESLEAGHIVDLKRFGVTF